MGYENSGRRPQPTALKVLRGNPGKRKPNPAEPIPPSGEVQKPLMSTKAGEIWDRLAPIATAMGTLTVADVTAFRTLCELQATLELASAQKDAPVTLAAAMKIEKEFAPIVRPYYALFGLDPVSRTRIQVPKKTAEPISKW